MNLLEPAITTIIPTYRRPKLLRRAILSVLNQKYQNFQICVYDNASGDETAEVVAEIATKDDRVKYYCHPINIGASANFNYAMAHVNTPFFSMLSDDDVVLPDFYTEALSGFETFPDAIFSAGSVINMTSEGQVLNVPLSYWKREGYFRPPDGLYEMIDGRHPTTTGVLFRKEVINIYKGIDPDIVVSDLDLEVRIAARFPFVISKKPCGIFVAHPSSAGVQANSSWIWPSCLKLIQNLLKDEHIPLDIRKNTAKLLEKYFRDTIFVLGLRSAIRGDFADAHTSSIVLGNHYHVHMKAIILKVVATVFERIWFVHKLARLSYGSLTIAYSIKNARLQKEFGYLARYLES